MSNQAKGYVPNGKVEEFIRMVGEGKAFVNMLVGANAVGKSAAGANILANIIYGVQNKYFDYPLFRNFPHPKKCRIISDPTTIKEKIIPELKRWFPSNEAKNIPEANYESAKEGKNFESKWETNTGWTISIMTTEQDTKEFESVDLGLVWTDEPIPQAVFNATISRGRLGMIMLMTYTPLFHAGWLKDWIDKNADGKVGDYVEADMEDNCKVHGIRGILEHEFIELMSESFPEEEREARVFGKFGHLIGMVHSKFKPKIHVIRPFPVDPRKFSTYFALDVHPRVPDHCMWMSVDNRGRKFVTGELLSTGLPKELAERIKALEAVMNYRMEDRLIDPSAFNDDQHREENGVGQQLAEEGIVCLRGSKDLTAGIKRTNEALDYQMQEGKMVRPPELFIFDTCKVTIKQLSEYVWDEYKGKNKDEKQPLGRPRDKDDHQPENLHRLLLHEPVYVPWSARNSSSVETGEESELDPYYKH